MLSTKSLQGIAIAFILFVGWIIYSADVGNNTIFFDVVKAIPNGDKLGHFFLFGVFTLLVNLGLNFKTWKGLPLGTVLVSIVIILEELSQAFFPNRTLDIVDLIADGLGVLAFTYLGYWLFEKFK
jgi:hypothetical protein